MAFGFSSWLLRQKIDAQVRTSGRPMEHRRISNPYHAVSIVADSRACSACQAIAGKRFLSTAAPQLPLAQCTNKACRCRYVHHDDRRAQRDRRVNFANPHAQARNDRRSGAGRRVND